MGKTSEAVDGNSKIIYEASKPIALKSHSSWDWRARPLRRDNGQNSEHG